MDKIKEYFLRYKEVIMYLFFGGCTTLVNIVAYAVCSRIFHMMTIPSTVAAWVLAVLFAYVTNRIWVFESNVTDRKGIIKEAASFFACRLLSGVMDIAIMWLFVSMLHMNDIVIKIFSNVLVIIVNFVASKLIIFKKKDA